MSNTKQTPVDPQIIKAYLECALWSSSLECDKTDEMEWSPESREQAETDIRRMLDMMEAREVAWPDYESPRYTDQELFGHDLWLTRNHYGVGFSDRGLVEVTEEGETIDLGEKLAQLACELGETYCYIGDDGQLWLEISPEE